MDSLGYVLISIRLWLLYYDYTNANDSLSIKWQQLILKQHINIPWSIRYKWLGSVPNLSIFAICISFMFIFIVVMTKFFIGNQSLGFTQLIPFIYLLFCLFLSFKIRKCRDILMIQS